MTTENKVPYPLSSKSDRKIDAQPDSFSKDGFSIIVYGLVVLAMLGQIGWIIWMEYLL